MLQQQILFACDRCGEKAVVPLFNKPPVDRMRPPEKWSTLIRDVPLTPTVQSAPMYHLCKRCTTEFDRFLDLRLDEKLKVQPAVRPAELTIDKGENDGDRKTATPGPTAWSLPTR